MQVECLAFCWSASHAARVPHMLLECLTCRWSASHERVPHMRPIGLRNSPSQLHALLKVLLIQINWLSYSKFKTIIKYKILFIYTVIPFCIEREFEWWIEGFWSGSSFPWLPHPSISAHCSITLPFLLSIGILSIYSIQYTLYTVYVQQIGLDIYRDKYIKY